jgi:hypothetical protein
VINRRTLSVTRRKNRKRSTAPCVGAIAVLAIIASGVPAKADWIPVTCSLTGTGTVVGATSTTLTLDAAALGSVLSGNAGLNTAWNPVTYSDEAVLDLNTGLLNGSFTLSFADGETLSGNVFEDNTAILASPTQTGPFTQTLTFLRAGRESLPARQETFRAKDSWGPRTSQCREVERSALRQFPSHHRSCFC